MAPFEPTFVKEFLRTRQKPTAETAETSLDSFGKPVSGRAPLEILIAAAAHWLHMHGWVLVETPADIDQAQWRMDNTNDPVRIADRIAWAESHSLWYAVSTLQNEPLATGGELPRRVAARCGLAPEPPQGARTDTAETTGATP